MKILMALALNVFLISAWAGDTADERDGELLKLTLNHLLPQDKGGKPEILILSELTAEYVIRGFDSPVGPGPRAGADKPSKEEIKMLVENLMSRNSDPRNNGLARRVSLAALELGPRVVVSTAAETTMKEAYAKHGNPKFWLEASLPGYSKDGRLAMVCLRSLPQTEGSLIKAFFENRDGRWKFLRMERVELRQ
jgi:hypothetical protein